MSPPKRSSPTPSPPQPLNLKQRTINSLNKLSDRDTYTLATTELDQIARDLTPDTFSPFLNCIYFIDPSQKPPLRKQCARLLGSLAQLHSNSLSPHLPKIISNLLRRLRDSDTSVRSTCIESISKLSFHITKPPFSVFLKPLMEAILVEQDLNSQIGASLSLAAAVESAPDPEISQLQRCVPRLLKLLKSDGFKAKPALLTLIRSIVTVGGADNQNVLATLFPCLVEFLSCDDWTARKATAEVFEKLALVERNLVSEFKSSVLPTFEARRFDKVKIVRDSMNRMLEAWKDVPDEVSQPAESKSSLKENASDSHYPPSSKVTINRAFESPQTRNYRSQPSKLTPPDKSSATNVRQRSPLKTSESKSTQAMFRKLDRNKPANWKVQISTPCMPPCTTVCEDDLQERDGRVSESSYSETNRRTKGDTKRSLFSRNNDDKMHKFGGLKSGSRVVPLHQDESLESTGVVSNNANELHGNNKSTEDLSLIRKQLIQIENQQSSLLDLLQKFMGSSQNGMQSLETRVQGLEMALDEISYDLAVSTGRISNPDTAGNTCCKLPGADFLSSKFWRKTEGRYSTSRFSSSLGTPSRTVMRVGDRDGRTDSFKLENRRFRTQGGGLVVNPLADIRALSREDPEVQPNSLSRNALHDYEGRETHNVIGFDMAATVGSISHIGTTSRSST